MDVIIIKQKEDKEGHTEGFRGRKGKRKWCNYIIVSKKMITKDSGDRESKWTENTMISREIDIVIALWLEEDKEKVSGEMNYD